MKSTYFPRFKKKIQSDIVSLINEILIFISYYYVYINKHLQLIHCSSLKLDKKNILIFGKHNIGKSTFCAHQSIKKNTIIYGDDLLLHDTKKGVFKSLGFPIRLRRPIDKKIINNFDKSKIVAGKKLAYIATNFFNSKNSGHTFEIDQFYELLKNSYLKSIKIIDVYKTLKKHTIDINRK